MAVQHVNRVQLQDPNGKGENIFYNANVLFRNASLSLSHVIGRSDVSQTSRWIFTNKMRLASSPSVTTRCTNNDVEMLLLGSAIVRWSCQDAERDSL